MISEIENYINMNNSDDYEKLYENLTKIYINNLTEINNNLENLKLYIDIKFTDEDNFKLFFIMFDKLTILFNNIIRFF